MKPIPAVFALVLIACAASAAEPLRVALVHGSYGDYRHRDDYDGAAKELGWKLDKFENKNFASLASQLDNYDVILGTALYNYQENVHDFSLYRDQLLAFMDRGGAIIFTDTNYPDHVNWLEKWGPEWAVGLANCATTSTPNKWIDASHPVFSATAPTRALNGTWMHMVPGSGWEVLSKCEDDGATALFRPYGRGYMLLTNFWPHGLAQLCNLAATQQHTRAGILPRLPDLTKLTFGNNALEGSFRNLTDKPLSLVMRVGMTTPGGDTPLFRAEATAQPKQAADLKLNVPLPRRGQYDLTLVLQVKDGAELTATQASVRIPELIEVEVLEPRYRASVMLAAPPQRVRAKVTLHPFEENLQGASWQAKLSRGQVLPVSTKPQAVSGNEFVATLPLPRGGSGDYTLHLALSRANKEIAGRDVTLPAIAPKPNQVFIDEDLNTRVDGKLFFPITLYHVPVKDFAQVKALGFNSLQAWGTSPQQAQENLDAAQANGLKVIVEGATHAAPDVLAEIVTSFRDHPALLSWYLTDEPSGEERLAWCRRTWEYLQRQDPHHPVYLTSCSPGEFARYAWVTDIFAVDPYPIPATPVTMVSSWMKTAQEAVQGRKPVWLIPQLHNWEAYGGHPERGRYPTPEEERNMVYQGLVWGAKGIFYYPWDDGSTGLIKDEKLLAAVGTINAELAQLGPELLVCKHEVTAQNDDAHKDLYAASYRGKGVDYIIAVNVATEAREFAVPAPGVNATRGEVLFEDRQAAVADGVIKDQFAPLAVHVYRLR